MRAKYFSQNFSPPPLKSSCVRPCLHQGTNFRSLQDSNLLSFVTMKPTLSLAHRAMEPGHLLHSALTCSPSGKARRLLSRHTFVSSAQQLISSSDGNNICAAPWADYRWNAEWLDNITTLRIFIPGIGRTLLEWSYQEQRESSLTDSASVSDVSTPACTNGIWPPLQPVSVAKKKEMPTMLSSIVQSIDLPMDLTA